MVPFDADDLWMTPKQIHHTGAVWTTVDHVTKADDPVLRLQSKAVQQGSKGCEMTVDVTNRKNSVPVVKTRLKVSLQGCIPR